MSVPRADSGIVVGVDGSPASDSAVRWAARDAAMRNVVSGARGPFWVLTEHDYPAGRGWVPEGERGSVHDGSCESPQARSSP